MSQYIRYPNPSISNNASVSTTGAAVPTSATLVAGKDGSGNLADLTIITVSGALKTDSSAVTQPVSAASLPLPTGASTSANQATEIASLSSIDGKLASLGQKAMAGSAPVVIASDQSAIPASQSGAWNITDVSGTVSLPTGAATSANQTTANTSLASIDGKLASLGQKAMAGSAPVVIASDQSAIPASQSGTWNINNVSGTVSLPTGAATAANQTTANTSLASIDGKLGSLGQKAMAGSAPVVIASDQSAVPIKDAVNANGSGSAAAATVSTVVTLTAPANAVGFVLQSLDTSSANVRWSIGRTATSTLGQQLQPGRDTGFIPCGANVSLCAESGTQNYDIQWISQ